MPIPLPIPWRAGHLAEKDGYLFENKLAMGSTET
jgi:hypothetical protein